MMHVTPEAKCVRQCLKPGSGVKYVLFDGKNAYQLSDQRTPAQFAAQKVRVVGILFEKTGSIEVQKIEPLHWAVGSSTGQDRLALLEAHAHLLVGDQAVEDG